MITDRMTAEIDRMTAEIEGDISISHQSWT